MVDFSAIAPCHEIGNADSALRLQRLHRVKTSNSLSSGMFFALTVVTFSFATHHLRTTTALWKKSGTWTKTAFLRSVSAATIVAVLLAVMGVWASRSWWVIPLAAAGYGPVMVLFSRLSRTSAEAARWRNETLYLRLLEAQLGMGTTLSQARASLTKQGLKPLARSPLRYFLVELAKLDREGLALLGVLAATATQWGKQAHLFSHLEKVQRGICWQAGFCAAVPWVLFAATRYFSEADPGLPVWVWGLSVVWEFGGFLWVLYSCRYL